MTEPKADYGPAEDYEELCRLSAHIPLKDRWPLPTCVEPSYGLGGVPTHEDDGSAEDAIAEDEIDTDDDLIGPIGGGGDPTVDSDEWVERVLTEAAKPGGYKWLEAGGDTPNGYCRIQLTTDPTWHTLLPGNVCALDSAKPVENSGPVHAGHSGWR